MVLGTIFEMLGAILVGARTADTIKNGIIPVSAPFFSRRFLIAWLFADHISASGLVV